MRLRALLLLLAFLTLAAQSSPALAGCTLGKMAELPVTMRGLRLTVAAKINGVEGQFLFDSGAASSTGASPTLTAFCGCSRTTPGRSTVADWLG